MRFSIVTVCYNSEHTITRTINSVLEQDYPDIEYIIIDGKSNDDTVKIIEEYRENLAYFVSEEDSGVYEAMNKGIAVARGDLVLFLNADDYLIHKSTISNAVSKIEDSKSKKADVFCGSLLVYNQSSGTGHVWRPGRLNKLYLYRGTLPHPATIYRRAVFKKAGMFDTNFKISGDHEWAVRAFIKKKVIFEFIDQLIAVFVKGGLSTNNEAGVIINKESDRIKEKHFTYMQRIYFPIRVRIKKTLGF